MNIQKGLDKFNEKYGAGKAIETTDMGRTFAEFLNHMREILEAMKEPSLSEHIDRLSKSLDESKELGLKMIDTGKNMESIAKGYESLERRVEETDEELLCSQIIIENLQRRVSAIEKWGTIISNATKSAKIEHLCWKCGCFLNGQSPQCWCKKCAPAVDESDSSNFPFHSKEWGKGFKEAIKQMNKPEAKSVEPTTPLAEEHKLDGVFMKVHEDYIRKYSKDKILVDRKVAIDFSNYCIAFPISKICSTGVSRMLVEIRKALEVGK